MDRMTAKSVDTRKVGRYTIGKFDVLDFTDGELIPYIVIDGYEYLASEDEYQSCDDWTEKDIANFLKSQLI